MATLLDFSAPHPLNWVQLTLDFPLREGSGVSAPQPRLAAHLVLTRSIQAISDAARPRGLAQRQLWGVEWQWGR